MLDSDLFVIDAVVHSYNLDRSNFAVPRHAEPLTEMIYGVVGTAEPEYRLSREEYIRDWDIEETARTLFLESATDIGIYHPVPIRAYHDGLISVEKAAEITSKYPQRFLTYCTVDPMDGQKALDELDRQVELLRPIGLKLYPSSWTADGQHRGWRMDDPEVAYPVYERAKQHGIKVIAIHKAVPLGIVPMDPYRLGDIDGAAADYPDLVFEIVHGGMAFLEETAWLLARFPNVMINLEALNIVCAQRPRQFAQAVLGMGIMIGDGIYDRMVWATGHMAYHARPSLEGLLNMEFPEDLLTDAGKLAPMSQITREHKKAILADNFVAMHSLDVEALKKGITDDDFARQRASNGEPAPWSSSERLAAMRQSAGSTEFAAPAAVPAG